MSAERGALACSTLVHATLFPTYFVKLAANRSDAPRARLSTFTHLTCDDEGEESTNKDDAPITMKPPDEAATVDTLPPELLSGVLSNLSVIEAFAFSSASKAGCAAVLELQAGGELVNSMLAERLIAEKVPPALANKFAYVTRATALRGVFSRSCTARSMNSRTRRSGRQRMHHRSPCSEYLVEDGFQVVRGRRRGGSTATSSGHAPSTM